LFTAHDPDYVVTEYDGSQIEFRVGGDISGDKRIESDIIDGVDIHTRTMNTMNAAYLKFAIKKELDRQAAKPNTFAPMYGSKGKDAAEEAYVAVWRQEYPALYREQTDWTLAVADQKKLRTKYGLIFYWPSAIMYGSGYVKYSTEIFNLPISGFATGEIIPIALCYFWHRTRGTRTRIFNTVHDSICVRNHRDDVEYITEIAKQAMTHDVYSFLQEVYGYTFNVPLGFGMKTARNWGASKTEHKWDVWRTGAERYQIEENKVTRVVYDTRNQRGEQ
jgi:DNA polymerase I-like protein with 3'-5' exonuclease and polymerase domains